MITDPKIDKRKLYSGKKHHNWKGGKYVDSRGYMRILIEGQYILEHRVIASQMLEGHLGDNEVHHVNGNKLDNRSENLLVLTSSEHAKLHRRLRPINPKKEIPALREMLKTMNGMQIAKRLGIGKSSVYRRMEEYGLR